MTIFKYTDDPVERAIAESSYLAVKQKYEETLEMLKEVVKSEVKGVNL
ncbi:MAG: hypothetical protein QXX55_01460 [Candidatus Pacearchaeota archaeon]